LNNRFLTYSIFLIFAIFLNSKIIAQNDIAQIEKQLRRTKNTIKSVEKKQSQSLTKLKLINSEIKLHKKLIKSLNREIIVIDKSITNNLKSIKVLKSSISVLNNEYEELIYYAYKTKDTRSRAAYIFSSESFNQAYKRFTYLQFFTDYVEQTTVQLNLKRDSLLALTNSMNIDKAKMLKLKEKQSDEVIELYDNLKEQQRIVKTLQYRKSYLEAQYKTKQLASKTLKNSVQVQKISENDGNKSQFTLNFERSKGKLKLPISGVITSTFGVHKHPVLENVQIINDGIEITVTKNSDVRVVHKGTVTKVVSIPGANTAIIIKHGVYFTVYSNLSKVTVKTGQIVYANQVIGKILCNSNTEHAYLDFQIWYKRTKLNPSNWLK